MHLYFDSHIKYKHSTTCLRHFQCGLLLFSVLFSTWIVVLCVRNPRICQQSSFYYMSNSSSSCSYSLISNVSSFIPRLEREDRDRKRVGELQLNRPPKLLAYIFKTKSNFCKRFFFPENWFHCAHFDV